MQGIPALSMATVWPPREFCSLRMALSLDTEVGKAKHCRMPESASIGITQNLIDRPLKPYMSLMSHQVTQFNVAIMSRLRCPFPIPHCLRSARLVIRPDAEINLLLDSLQGFDVLYDVALLVKDL